MNRDIVNLIAIPGVCFLSWVFPPITCPLLSVYLLTDCIRPIKKEIDIQIIFHRIVSTLFIIQKNKEPVKVLELFTFLECSSYLLILGRVTGSRFIKKLSKLVWIMIRIFWINWFHWNYNGYNWLLFLQTIKWLGYMWTLNILNVKMLPCHLSAMTSFELVILKSDIFTSILCICLLSFSWVYHHNYTNPMWHKIDRTYVRFWIVYNIVRFHWSILYWWHLLGVVIVFPFMPTDDRTWWNLPKLLPHMLMHVLGGRGLTLSLETQLHK